MEDGGGQADSEKMLYTPEHAERARAIVERLLPHVSPRPEYRELLEILGDSTRWAEAHSLFCDIRGNITLPFEKREKDGLDSLFVYVAENAAKTAYNCSGEPAPFDDDSFDWLLKCEKDFLSAQDSLLDPDTVSQTTSEQVVGFNGEKRGWFASLWTSFRRRG